MSLSDPSLTPLGTTAVTPKQQAQVREVVMNSSMMYMHEVRGFHQKLSVKKNQLHEIASVYCMSNLIPSVRVTNSTGRHFSLKTRPP